MTFYDYTVKVSDFSGQYFPEGYPRVSVVAQRDGWHEGAALARRTIPVTLDASGSGTVRLAASVDVVPDPRYLLRCEWISEFDDEPLGWSEWFVAAIVGGGSLSEGIGAPASVWFVGPPWPSVLVPGAFYVNRFTNDWGRA